MMFRAKIRFIRSGGKTNTLVIRLEEGEALPISSALLEEQEFSETSSEAHVYCKVGIRNAALCIRLMAPTEKLYVNEQEGNDFVLKAGDLVKIAGHSFEILDAPLPQSLVGATRDTPRLEDTTDSSIDIVRPPEAIGSPEAQSQQIHRAEPATVTVENVLLNIMPDLTPMDISDEPTLPKAVISSPSIDFPIHDSVPPEPGAPVVEEQAVCLEPPRPPARPPEPRPPAVVEPVIPVSPPTFQRGGSPNSRLLKTTALAASLFTAMLGSLYLLEHRIVPVPSTTEVAESPSSPAQTYSEASTVTHKRQPASKPSAPPTEHIAHDFFAAVKGGDLKTMKALITSNEIDPGAQRLNGRTALMEATRYGQTGAVKYLLTKKVNLNAQDPNGDTALMYATRENRLEIAKLLVAKGASRSTHAVGGESPLQVAVRENHVALAQVLKTKTSKHTRRPASHPRQQTWH